MNKVKNTKIFMLGLDGAMKDFIRQNAENGNFPNFKRVMDGGVTCDNCMPVFPSITPTCWASISTGAVPSIHGAIDQERRISGGTHDMLETTYDSFKISAEMYWEAACKAGNKALIIDVPCSGPARVPGVFQVGSYAQNTDPIHIDSHMIKYHHYYIPAQFFEIADQKPVNPDIAKDLRFKTASGPWQPMKREDAIHVKIDETNTYVLPVIYNEYASECRVIPFTWNATIFGDGILISYDGGDKEFFLKPGEWTGYFFRTLQTTDGKEFNYTFNIKLNKFDLEKRMFSLIVPPATCTNTLATPQSYADELAKLQFIRDAYLSQVISNDNPDVDTFLECRKIDFDYHKTIIEYTLANYDIDIVFDYFGYPDTINHIFRGILEGVQKDKQFLRPAAEQVEYWGYKYIDDYLGWILDEVIDDETTLVICGDHGSVGNDTMFIPHEILEKAGLLTFSDDKSHWLAYKWGIDWSKTKAYPMYSGHIFVNLEGRDPQGIVKPEDYNKVVNEIIIALQDGLRDKGEVALAFAVEGAQAGFVEQGGPLAGDVVYGLTGSRIGGHIGGVHSCQMPSAKTKTGGDIRPVCMFMGPKLKKGVILDRPIDLTDIAPTLMFAAGYPQPADATGGIISQALSEGI